MMECIINFIEFDFTNDTFDTFFFYNNKKGGKRRLNLNWKL